MTILIAKFFMIACNTCMSGHMDTHRSATNNTPLHKHTRAFIKKMASNQALPGPSTNGFSNPSESPWSSAEGKGD